MKRLVITDDFKSFMNNVFDIFNVIPEKTDNSNSYDVIHILERVLKAFFSRLSHE